MRHASSFVVVHMIGRSYVLKATICLFVRTCITFPEVYGFLIIRMVIKKKQPLVPNTSNLRDPT